MQQSTRVYLHGVEYALPEHRYSQSEALDVMNRLDPFEGAAARKRRRIYENSGIEYRHSVLGEFKSQGAVGALFSDSGGKGVAPTTAMRNEIYTREARNLSLRAVRQLLDRHAGLITRVTHLITVSCTGFSAPGFDFYLVKDLGLNANVDRFHLGFMGCFAAFPALKLAKSICEANAEATVLVVNVELCSLHLQFKDDTDIVVANALFADGVSAAVVSARAIDGVDRRLRLDAFRSHTIPKSEDDMAWTIGDTGFDMRLSAYVPRFIEQDIASILDGLLAEQHRVRDDVDVWAIHPGGRAILDRVAGALAIPIEKLLHSYEVLRAYGNMSSVTIMFVLKRILEGADVGRVFAAAFGPGLTVESGLLTVE
ncbi:MAG: type III polyketide synthase [Spirochaetales bacterium]